MAKSKKITPIPEEPVEDLATQQPEVVEVDDTNTEAKVSFALDDELGDEEIEDSDEEFEDLAGAVASVGQLLMTEEGEAVADILRGILDALDKQNKILFRGLQLLESRR